MYCRWDTWSNIKNVSRFSVQWLLSCSRISQSMYDIHTYPNCRMSTTLFPSLKRIFRHRYIILFRIKLKLYAELLINYRELIVSQINKLAFLCMLPKHSLLKEAWLLLYQYRHQGSRCSEQVCLNLPIHPSAHFHGVQSTLSLVSNFTPGRKYTRTGQEMMLGSVTLSYYHSKRLS